MHMLHTQTSDAPLKLASEGIPFMIVTDLGNQPIFRRSLKEIAKLGKIRFSELNVIY